MAPSVGQRQPRAAPRRRRAFQLTVDYLKQETVEPLRGLGRFLYMGIAGSFFLAFGLLLILLGVLRLLQTETGTALTGDWSWVPYAVVVVLGIVVIGVAAWRITAGPGPGASCPRSSPGASRERSRHRRERADAGTTTRAGATDGSSRGRTCRRPTPR